uniref:TOG array regulator of axonemal microtubules 1 n=1 Tax=Latimeria chalumnae TaxID=7897 RepID=H2ZW64_LATCH
SLNLSYRAGRKFYSAANVERTLSFPSAANSQGTFILPSYPLSSPRTSPKHTSPPGRFPKKVQDQNVTFSNSWPTKHFEGLPAPSPQKKLPSYNSEDVIVLSSQEKQSPIPLKAALVRSPSSRRGLNATKPVPPIPRGKSPSPDKTEMTWDQSNRSRSQKSDEFWETEMGNEKDKTLELDLSGLNIREDEADHEEMMSSLRSLRNSAAKKRAKLSGSASDLESPDSALKLDLTLESPSRTSSPYTSPYSESGVSSQESLTSPLFITPRSRRTVFDNSSPFGSKPRLARVPSGKLKATHTVEYSPNSGSAINMQQINNHDAVSGNGLSEDSVVIVGKGVFGSPPTAALIHNHSIPPCAENGEELSIIKQNMDPPTGIYGRAVQQNSQSTFESVENDKDVKVSMSKSARDKMRQKKKEEKDQNQKEQQETKDYEKKENLRERLKSIEPEKTSTEGELSPGTRSQRKDRTPSVPHSPEIMDSSELRPFSKPELALAEALRLLADEDWEKKIEGLNFVRSLSAYHSDVLTIKLHETVLAVIQEIIYIFCILKELQLLYLVMTIQMWHILRPFLAKALESNYIFWKGYERPNGELIIISTVAKSLISFLLNAEVYYGRKMLCFMMSHPDFDKLLEKYLQPKDLPYIKETVSNLHQKGLGEMPLDTPSAKGRRSHSGSGGSIRLSSSSKEAHNYTGRWDVSRDIGEPTWKPAPKNLFENAEYVKELTGLLSAKDFRERIKGIEQLLSDCQSNQDLLITNIVKIFDAFRPRLHDSNSKVNQMALETMKIMIPLLKDNLGQVINVLVPAIVDNNLNSKNLGIYNAAISVIQALTQHLDNSLLLQPFCTKAQFLNGKAKQEMTEKVADLVMELYPRKPQAVEQKVLPVLWHLLGNMTSSGSLPGSGGNIRTATTKLVKVLFLQMGRNLFDQAASQPPHIRKTLEEFLEMQT